MLVWASAAIAGAAILVWTQQRIAAPAPPHHFSFPVRVLNAVANAVWLWTGVHLINPWLGELQKVARSSDLPCVGGSKQTQAGVKALCETFEGSCGNGEECDYLHGGLLPVGRMLTRQITLSNLRHRASVANYIQQHPSIVDIPVHKPIIISGFFRSGTTLLVRLLSQDPKARHLKLWEMSCDAPPAVKELHETDPRVDEYNHKLYTLDRVQPTTMARFNASHHSDARNQEEETNLLNDSLKGVHCAALVCKPKSPFWRWLLSQDNSDEAYLFLRRFLQYASSSYPPPSGGHFILKSPYHLLWQDSLYKQFPDARYVYCVRDPSQSVPSCIKLFDTLAGLYINWNHPSFDRKARCRQWIDLCYEMHRREVDFAQRGVIPDQQRVDVRYTDLVRDPVQTVKHIYAHFGEQVSPEYEQGMRQFLADNPQGKHGRASYSLEDYFESQESLDGNEHVQAFRKHFGV